VTSYQITGKDNFDRSEGSEKKEKKKKKTHINNLLPHTKKKTKSEKGQTGFERSPLPSPQSQKKKVAEKNSVKAKSGKKKEKKNQRPLGPTKWHPTNL